MTDLTLDEAVDLTRTGDLWLFRGRSAADHAIRALTNSPVNHVGMAVVLDDLPARPPELPRAARFEVLAALAIVLVFHSLVARIAGVALGIGAVVPDARWRPLGYAFLAGLALLSAPFVALPVAVCAAYRWRFERL